MGEGLALYTIILANWTSNDLYYENEFNTDIVKGYMSYKVKDTIKTIFWREIDTTSAAYKAKMFKQVGDTGILASKQPKRMNDLRLIFKTICYPKMSVTKANAVIPDEEERSPNAYEKMMMDYRASTYKEINSDTMLFKRYDGTQLKAIPLDMGKEVKVYVYSSSTSDDYVPLGGDYLLVYDKKEKLLVEKQKLHSGLILISSRYKGASYDASKSTFHNHKGETSELITPTDIAILLLYKKRIEWDEHHVVSDKYTCIFTLIDRKLQIIPTEEYEYLQKKRIMQDKEAAKANWH